jgi:hypothetical protein
MRRLLALNNGTAQIAIDKTPKNPGFMGKPFQATYMPREKLEVRNWKSAFALVVMQMRDTQMIWAGDLA